MPALCSLHTRRTPTTPPAGIYAGGPKRFEWHCNRSKNTRSPHAGGRGPSSVLTTDALCAYLGSWRTKLTFLLGGARSGRIGEGGGGELQVLVLRRHSTRKGVAFLHRRNWPSTSWDRRISPNHWPETHLPHRRPPSHSTKPSDLPFPAARALVYMSARSAVGRLSLACRCGDDNRPWALVSADRPQRAAFDIKLAVFRLPIGPPGAKGRCIGPWTLKSPLRRAALARIPKSGGRAADG